MVDLARWCCQQAASLISLDSWPDGAPTPGKMASPDPVSNFSGPTLVPVGLNGPDVVRALRCEWASLPVRGGLRDQHRAVLGAGDEMGPGQFRQGFRCMPALGRLFLGQGIPIAPPPRNRDPSTALAVRCMPTVERVTAVEEASRPGCGRFGAP